MRPVVCNSDTFRVSETDSKQMEKVSLFYVRVRREGLAFGGGAGGRGHAEADPRRLEVPAASIVRSLLSAVQESGWHAHEKATCLYASKVSLPWT